MAEYCRSSILVDAVLTVVVRVVTMLWPLVSADFHDTQLVRGLLKASEKAEQMCPAEQEVAWGPDTAP